MKPIYIDATTISDAWFQLLYNLDDYGDRYTIDRGSFEGSDRIEFPFATVRIRHPEMEPRLPVMPEGSFIPPPTDKIYVEDYFVNYIMSPVCPPDTCYTYGQRLSPQFDAVYDMLKSAPNTNHAILRVAQIEDLTLDDPPCLERIMYKIRDGKLWCYPSFRSWDLWGGLPVNLGGIQLLNDAYCEMLEVKMGEMVAVSPGLHIYGHHEDIVKIRTGRG